MGNHRRFSHALGKLMGDSLHQPPGVDEDQRGAMTTYQIGYRIQSLAPDLVGGYGAHFLLG